MSNWYSRHRLQPLGDKGLVLNDTSVAYFVAYFVFYVMHCLKYDDKVKTPFDHVVENNH